MTQAKCHDPISGKMLYRWTLYSGLKRVGVTWAESAEAAVAKSTAKSATHAVPAVSILESRK